MKTFSIWVTEENTYKFFVEANSRDEAIDFLQKAIDEGEQDNLPNKHKYSSIELDPYTVEELKDETL